MFNGNVSNESQFRLIGFIQKAGPQRGCYATHKQKRLAQVKARGVESDHTSGWMRKKSQKQSKFSGVRELNPTRVESPSSIQTILSASELHRIMRFDKAQRSWALPPIGNSPALRAAQVSPCPEGYIHLL